MIRIVTKVGNLMNVASGHIVHGCNAQGVMGSGVALAVKLKYRHVFEHYRARYELQGVGLNLGEAYPVPINDNLIVWNAITQDKYGYGTRQTSYDAVATCFEQINTGITAAFVLNHLSPPTEIHIPLIGAGRGGGNWEIIREIIEQTMSYPVTLWMPDDTVDTI